MAAESKTLMGNRGAAMFWMTRVGVGVQGRCWEEKDLNQAIWSLGDKRRYI